MSGPLRKNFYDLLIKLHLESFTISRSTTIHEYVIPLTNKLKENTLEKHKTLMEKGYFPSREDFVSVLPSILRDDEIKNENQKLLLIPPKFNLENLKNFVINSFAESVKLCTAHVRDPIGGSNAFLFV